MLDTAGLRQFLLASLDPDATARPSAAELLETLPEAGSWASWLSLARNLDSFDQDSEV